MRTRRGLCYPGVVATIGSDKDVTGMMFSDRGLAKRKKDMNKIYI